MKQTLILILAVLLLSCNTHESKKIELIAYHWGIHWDYKNDSAASTLTCKFYAQIEEDGNCILNIEDYRKGNRFITFKINKEILDSVYRLVYKADSDTTVCKKAEPFTFYDGPSIRIAGKNKSGKPVQLRFRDDNERSNSNCQKLYNYIDSISLKLTNNPEIDTTKILQAKEKLMKGLYKKDQSSMTIRMTAPVIKKDELPNHETIPRPTTRPH